MASLPPLLEEDIQLIDSVLVDFLKKSEATSVLMTNEGGGLVLQHGDTTQIDTVTLGALASNAFNATQAIAKVIDEPSFGIIYQQGAKLSMLVVDIEQCCVLVVVFPSGISVGAVKFYITSCAQRIAEQLRKANGRDPGEGIAIELPDFPESAPVFRKK